MLSLTFQVPSPRSGICAPLVSGTEGIMLAPLLHWNLDNEEVLVSESQGLYLKERALLSCVKKKRRHAFL